MARIIYGVHGTGHGHAVRALTVARHYPQHDFLFVSHGSAAALLREFEVFECDNPETPVVAHRVHPLLLAQRNLRFLRLKKRLMQSVVALIDRFKPDVAITDYEFFVPRVARLTGTRCLSLDHTHIVTAGQPEVPLRECHSYLVSSRAIGGFLGPVTEMIVSSFFDLPLRPSSRPTCILPPLLREGVFRNAPQDDGHILSYQGYTTFRRFLPFLKESGRPVLAYGVGASGADGNITFREHSEERFLSDLASCSYVVCGGGHTLISEALFYGKPVMSFPVRMAFEQFVNAFYIEKLGYGRLVRTLRPGPNLIPAFEEGLDGFQRNVKSCDFCGNSAIFDRLDRFILGD